VLHDRDGVQRAERHGGRGREAEGAAAARHERQQRGGGGQRAATEHEHEPRPLVEAAVGGVHRRDGAEALRDPGGKIVPAARGEQARGHAGRGQRDEQQDGGGEQRRAEPHAGPRLAPAERAEQGARQRAREDTAQQRVGGRGPHHPGPLHRAERGERDEADQPRDVRAQ
jgi:hypothetical protein